VICYTKIMDDKRIKLITTEMFIMWGTFTILLLLLGYDANFIKSTYPLMPFYGKLILLLFSYSNFPVKILYPIAKFIRDFVNEDILLIILLLCQLTIYWAIGNLFGRFIVWIKHLRKKSKPQPEE